MRQYAKQAAPVFKCAWDNPFYFAYVHWNIRYVLANILKITKQVYFDKFRPLRMEMRISYTT